MNDKYDARIQQVIDRYLQSSYGLWNALLTINGIMLASTSFVPPETFNSFNVVILLLALLSIALLFYNYVVMKITYFRIGEVLSGDPDELTEEKKEKDIQLSLSRNKRVQFIENICLGVLVLQALLIIISLIY